MIEINPKDYILVRDKNSLLYLAKLRTSQNNNWEPQIRKLDERKGFMTEISDLLELRVLLDSKKKVFDGNGNLISTQEKQLLLDENFGERDPWRSEYLGNRFVYDSNKLYMESRFRVRNNQVVPLIRKKINTKKRIMQDGYTSYKYFNEDGLVTKLKGREVYFSYPKNNSVARFVASSDGADLGCYGDLGNSGSSRGVRESRENFEV